MRVYSFNKCRPALSIEFNAVKWHKFHLKHAYTNNLTIFIFLHVRCHNAFLTIWNVFFCGFYRTTADTHNISGSCFLSNETGLKLWKFQLSVKQGLEDRAIQTPALRVFCMLVIYDQLGMDHIFSDKTTLVFQNFILQSKVAWPYNSSLSSCVVYIADEPPQSFSWGKTFFLGRISKINFWIQYSSLFLGMLLTCYISFRGLLL